MKNDDIAQGLAEPWAEEPVTIDGQEVASVSVTTDRDGDDAEAGRFEDSEERPEIRDVIRGLETLWGKAPLPADFREIIAAPLPPNPR